MLTQNGRFSFDTRVQVIRQWTREGIKMSIAMLLSLKPAPHIAKPQHGVEQY